MKALLTKFIVLLKRIFVHIHFSMHAGIACSDSDIDKNDESKEV